MTFHFYDVLVDVSVTTEEEKKTEKFWEKVMIYGDWNTAKCIYNCDGLESDAARTGACADWTVADNEVTVSDKER